MEPKSVQARLQISPTSTPIVWGWITHTGAYRTKSLTSLIAFSAEAFLKISNLGFKFDRALSLDSNQFSQPDPNVNRQVRSEYPLKISAVTHPELYKQVEHLESPGDRGKVVAHLFECWIVCVWAQTISSDDAKKEPLQVNFQTHDEQEPAKNDTSDLSSLPRMTAERATEGEKGPDSHHEVTSETQDREKKPGKKSHLSKHY